MDLKYGAGVAIVICLLLLVAIFIAFNVYLVWRGNDNLKKDTAEAKVQRTETEALELAEEEERRARKKKDDDDWNAESGPTPIEATVS